MKLHELASVVRSKNAGPFLVTIDLFFHDAAGYERVHASEVLSVESVARLYGVTAADVRGVFWEPGVLGAKVTIRKHPSVNELECSDLFGSHQHIPIAMAEV